jgi:hypothetical protein
MDPGADICCRGAQLAPAGVVGRGAGAVRGAGGPRAALPLHLRAGCRRRARQDRSQLSPRADAVAGDHLRARARLAARTARPRVEDRRAR